MDQNLHESSEKGATALPVTKLADSPRPFTFVGNGRANVPQSGQSLSTPMTQLSRQPVSDVVQFGIYNYNMQLS